jgi:glutathione synthase/RimK-type ligase-like ATP-grasp enzyme
MGHGGDRERRRFGVFCRILPPVHDLGILFEHPEWQKPLFRALDARGVAYVPLDVKRAAYGSDAPAPARVIFNQASPSAYVRGHTRAVPHALAMLRHLERCGCDVLNGADAFALELSKAAQVAMCRAFGIDHPHSIVFNDVEAAIAATPSWPRLLKPDLGGSGARIQVVDDGDALRAVFTDEAIWAPDNLFLLQEYLPHDPEHGIIRLEILDGELLYPMRVVTHGRFNLCPSPVCNPGEGDEEAMCEVPLVPSAPVEFYPFPEVPPEAVAIAKRLLAAADIDVGGVEYLETPDGRRVFYDINANSNLRPSVAEHFGVDPFERVVDFLERRIARARGSMHVRPAQDAVS